LTDVTVPIAEDIQLLFVEADTEGADDPDVYVIDSRAHELDTWRPALREQWLLAVPALVVPGRLQGTLSDLWCRSQRRCGLRAGF
jgi:hypothetical protein